ncbi:MAG: hypothetical protein ACXACY_22890 [Candidatus Hodarchaeales archaeon]
MSEPKQEKIIVARKGYLPLILIGMGVLIGFMIFLIYLGNDYFELNQSIQFLLGSVIGFISSIMCMTSKTKEEIFNE